MGSLLTRTHVTLTTGVKIKIAQTDEEQEEHGDRLTAAAEDQWPPRDTNADCGGEE